MKLGKFQIILDGLSEMVQVRDNFKNVISYLLESSILSANFTFFKASVKIAGSHTMIHNLGYMPLDVITLSVSKSDSTVVTWRYDNFTDKTVTFTTNGPVTVRALLGRYRET